MTVFGRLNLIIAFFTILFLSFLFSFDWEDMLNTWDSVSSAIFGNAVKHGLLVSESVFGFTS